MKVIQEVKYSFSENDYKTFIKPQLKQKHIKVKEIAEILKISKSHLHRILNGQVLASAELVNLLVACNIALPFESVVLITGVNYAKRVEEE